MAGCRISTQTKEKMEEISVKKGKCRSFIDCFTSSPVFTKKIVVAQVACIFFLVFPRIFFFRSFHFYKFSVSASRSEEREKPRKPICWLYGQREKKVERDQLPKRASTTKQLSLLSWLPIRKLASSFSIG